MLSFDQTVQVMWERMQWQEALCSDMWAVEAHFLSVQDLGAICLLVSCSWNKLLHTKLLWEKIVY
jgi:hypothetical protein